MTPQIELHIEELALHGRDTEQARAVGPAVVAELIRLLTERGLPTVRTDRGLSTIDAGIVSVDERGARTLGAQVAGRVHGSLRR